MLDDTTFVRRLGDRAPQILSDVSRLQRNQILVDEATDFSPIQLACMATLCSPWTDSFFACGDFNQRLTVWGTRSTEHLKWIFKDLAVREIDVAYRQSRRLNELAAILASSEGSSTTRLPEHVDNEGVRPVFGAGLGELAELVKWLSARITEIESFSGQLPSIAVLVNEPEMLAPLAEGISTALAGHNIRAVACPDGQVMGQENDVRVFEVEHIKGLEFEAVFFVDVDKLEELEPALFDKYLYVGATRAATYLGITCSAPLLPSSLAHVEALFAPHW
jgi:DNA helicase IV